MRQGAGNQAGLYIHIPFCLSKCPYCAFNSFTLAKQDTTAYLNALHLQMRRLAAHPQVAKHVFSTIFVGGGTPTIYSGKQLVELISAALHHFQFTSQPEITVESNPNSLNLGLLTSLREAGVNRLSIGVQSFSDKFLVRLGRTHSVSQAANALEAARTAGFTDLNIDLMYGLPGQDCEDWRQTLETACQYWPEHLAVYELTVEEKTPFAEMAAVGVLDLPNEDVVADMAELTLQVLSEAGFVRYEIANFAQPGKECLHNINYWHNGQYLGLGAGAVSYITGSRISNISDPGRFARRVKAGNDGFCSIECLCREKRFRETVIMGLRMTKGLSLVSLQECFDLDPRDYYGASLRKLQDNHLVEITEGNIYIPARALPVANQAMKELV